MAGQMTLLLTRAAHFHSHFTSLQCHGTVLNVNVALKTPPQFGFPLQIAFLILHSDALVNLFKVYKISLSLRVAANANQRLFAKL